MVVMKGIGGLLSRGSGCSGLLSCLYDLGEGDIAVLRAVALKREATLDEISAALSRDRSTVHRSLSRLLVLGMCYRTKRGIRGGGYYHVYGLVDTERISRKVKGDVREMIASLNTLLSDFSRNFDEMVTGA
jgi:predicted transcriptional regulator